MEPFPLPFDLNLRGVAYADPQEQLADLTRLLDLYLHHGLRTMSGAGGGEEVPYHLKGMVIPPQQVERAVAGTEIPPDPRVRQQLEAGWAYLESRVFPQLGEQVNLLYWTFLELYTSRFQRICFLLGAAHRADRKYERIFGYLHDNAQEQTPGLALAYGLSGLEGETSLVECLEFANADPSWNLFLEGWGSGMATSFTMRESAFSALLGLKTVDSSIGSFVRLDLLHSRNAPLSELVVRRELCEEMGEVYRSCLEREQPCLFFLAGDKGSGRSFLFRHVAARIGQDLLVVELDGLAGLPEPELRRAAQAIASCCVLNLSIPLLCCDDAEQSPLPLRRLLRLFGEQGVNAVFLAGPRGLRLEDSGEYLCFPHQLNRLSPQEACRLWEHRAQQLPCGELDIPQLANKYRLSPRQIQATLDMANLYHAGESIRPEDVAHAIRGGSTGASGLHGRRVTPFFSIGDIILPNPVREQVLRIIDRIRQDYFVNTQWGFDRKYAYGKGIGMLFYGQPGTGKSMCAHTIAHELGLDLLQVDLSSVVSKYVGETEKNLTGVFREAESSNTVLFFDEADSLFAQRSSDMGGANDRYANIETSHLLQKMEEFGGICILTTNMAMNFDKAFFRRLEYVVNIPMPDEATRKIIWERSFPEQCALGGGIPFDLLARTLEMSPSAIKSVAKQAAFLALYAGSEHIRLEHILDALKLDFVKCGKTLPAIPGIGYLSAQG